MGLDGAHNAHPPFPTLPRPRGRRYPLRLDSRPKARATRLVPQANAHSMTFTHLGKSIQKVAVIGSGQIGPDIALFFTKVLSPFGVKTIVVDVAQAALVKSGDEGAANKTGATCDKNASV
jgi:threonine dehydrogenase-like Zn-dependent dehydrogenase